MTTDFDLQTQAEELDIGKLLKLDYKEWGKAYALLAPVAKKAAAAAVHIYDESFLEDVVQITLVEFHEILPQFTEKPDILDLKNMVARIAKCRAIDQVRKEPGARRKKQNPDAEHPPLPDKPNAPLDESTFENRPYLDPEMLGVAEEVIPKTLEQLGGMDMKFRIMVEKHVMGDYTLERVASEINVKMGSIGKLKENALEQFKKLLRSDERGKELADLLSGKKR
jgi:DNA-directed RNA polymerase specialized sigma24 family protein